MPDRIYGPAEPGVEPLDPADPFVVADAAEARALDGMSATARTNAVESRPVLQDDEMLEVAQRAARSPPASAR